MARLGKFSCFFNLFSLAAWIYLDVSCSAQEVVRYVSEKAPTGFAEVVGVIEKEGPAGIQIKSKGNVVIVPALDVVTVQYRHHILSDVFYLQIGINGHNTCVLLQNSKEEVISLTILEMSIFYKNKNNNIIIFYFSLQKYKLYNI